MPDRGRVCSVLCALTAAAAAMACVASQAQPASSLGGHGAGIWKAAVPAKPMTGEFGNLDPLGVAAGARIRADCSLNWIDPDDGKRYCFASGTSLVYFLDRPHANLERARQSWQRMSAARK